MQSDTKPAVFDRSATFLLQLKREKLEISVRYPSDEEWAQRQRKVTTIIHRMSGGVSQTKTTGMEEADDDLLSRIRIGDGPELTEGLASALIARLSRAEADEPEATADGYVIPLRVITGLTRHELRCPTEKEKRTYQRAAYAFLDRRHGKQELKTSLSAVCDFYDRLAVSVTGYAGVGFAQVPAPHKLSAISELMTQIDAEEDEQDPANFS